MRIHTTLDYLQMLELTRASGAPIGFERIEEHGSQTHARAFEVRLTGTGGRSNTGLYGSGDYSGATWDEWGAFFGALFEADPTARCGGTAKRPTYANADHYHFETGDRFRRRVEVVSRHDSGAIERTRVTHLPADTHPRHGWVYQDGAMLGTGSYKCRRCSATRPGWKTSENYQREVIA